MLAREGVLVAEGDLGIILGNQEAIEGKVIPGVQVHMVEEAVRLETGQSNKKEVVHLETDQNLMEVTALLETDQKLMIEEEVLLGIVGQNLLGDNDRILLLN